MHVLPSSDKLSSKPCNGYERLWYSLFCVLALLCNCCRGGLASLETNKQQFNRSDFVKIARAPIDCVQIQLDECVQIKYLGTRHMGQSTWLLKICVQKKKMLASSQIINRNISNFLVLHLYVFFIIWWHNMIIDYFNSTFISHWTHFRHIKSNWLARNWLVHCWF